MIFLKENYLMLKYKIIVNPISGRGFALKMIPVIEQKLKDLGLEFDLVQTERPWHAAELAETAAKEGYDIVVSASGDGTANEVLNGLMRARNLGATKTAMGIITVGTGNDLAYGMKVVILEMELEWVSMRQSGLKQLKSAGPVVCWHTLSLH
jgi:diacylglycerol kinase (ATP)